MLSVLMAKAVMYDKKISTLLSVEDFKRVDSVLQSLSQYNLKMFDMFKPVQVSTMISLLQTQKENADLLKKYDGTALDIHFANEGKRLGKTVTPLETLEQQCEMLFNHFTVEEQAKQLVEMIKQSELTSKFSVDMTNAYLKKDIGTLMKMINEAPKEITGGNMDHMLKDRNKKWVNVLPALMKSGSQFIAVGAGHLPGNDGLITLLQKQGYTVTPVLK